jgi:hypothetical protein
MTHTYTLMEVSRAAFDEIKAKMLKAGYEHAVHDDWATLDMHGIALALAASTSETFTIKRRVAVDETTDRKRD